MADETLVLKLQLDATSTIKTTDDLIERNKDLAKLLKSAPREGEEGFEALSDSIKKASQEYAKNRQEILKFNKELREVEVASDSMKGLSRQLKKLEDEYKLLTKEQRQAFGAELKANIQATRAELSELEGDLGDYRRNVGNYPETTASSFFDLGNTIKGLGVAAVASLTFDAAKEAAQAVAQVTEEFKILRGEIQTLTDATGPELDEYTIKIAAIGETFDQSTEEVLLAANALTKNLTGDFNTSLELIEQGFLSGANANNELLDSLIEYPALIKEAGLSGEEFISIISQSATQGIFSDKGVDAIKESGIALREQTQATQDAVIGLFGEAEGKELLGDINTGEVSILDAIKKISTRIGELPPQSQEVGTAIADIFKGAGEDAGLDFITSLKDIDGNVEGLIDTSNELTASQIKQLEAQENLARAQNETSKRFASLVDGGNRLGVVLQTFLFKALNTVFDILAPIGKAFSGLGKTLSDFGKRIGIVGNQGSIFESIIGSLTFGIRLLAMSITAVINFIGFLIDGLAYAYENFTLVRTAVNFTVSVFNELVKVFSNLPATFSGISAAIRQLGSNLSDWFATVLLNAQIFAKQLDRAFTVRQSSRERLENEIEGLRSQKQNIADAGRSVGEAFNEAFEDAIAEAEAKKIISDAVTGLDVEDEVKRVASSSGAAFTDLFNKNIDVTETADKITTELPAALEEVIESGSVDALRNKVSELESLLGTLNPKSEQFLETANKVKEATEKLNEAEALRQQALATESELLAQQQEKAKELEAQRKAASDKALADAQAQINLELEQAKRAAQILRDTQLESDELTAEQRKAIQQEYLDSIEALELEAQNKRVELLEEGSEQRLKLEQEIADKELAIREELYNQDFEKARENEQRKKELRDHFNELAFESAQLLSDGLFAIAAANTDNEEQAQLEKLEQETELKLASANLSEEERTRIEQEAQLKRDEIEKAAAKKRQKQAITQAIINGALAAVQALANTTLPFPLSLTALIPIALNTALQIATIKKQKFARGKGQIARGKTHAQGGIDALLGGRELVEIEDQESIVNRISSNRFKQTLSDINQAGGGIRFDGTAPLSDRRRRFLNLFELMGNQAPTLAKRGLAPSMSSMRIKRKFQDGGIAVPGTNNERVSAITKQDIILIAQAAEAGTKSGIEKANIYENFKRQFEREAALEDRSQV